MSVQRLITALLGLVSIAGAFAATEKTPLDSVDPTIGTTHCRWFFFTPGARPFGMAKPGPCTDAHLGNQGGWEAVGYDSRHESIESFVSFREFQIGGVAVMATSGELQTVPGRLDHPDEGYRSRFSHDDEKASPGYYSVLLRDYGIKAELTATPRVAFHRFTFTESKPGHLIFDIGNKQGESGPVLDSFLRQVNDKEWEGFVVTHPVYVRAYQPGAQLKMYFVAEMDQAPQRVGVFRGSEIVDGGTSLQGKGAGFFATFSPEPRTVVVKLGLSYTSIENARANLRQEAGGVSFDDALRAARSDWGERLGRIQVHGGRESDRVKFYTGLYHALLGRGLASDVNGAYPKNDGSIGQIPLTNGVPSYNHYNSDSVWGSFWNLNQLWALAYPDYLSEYVRCHLDHYRDCGWLPDSIAAGKFVSGVGTDFAGVLVSSAYAWGIRDFDTRTAFTAALKNEIGWQNRPVGVGKADLKSFLDRGYVPLIYNVPGFSAATADGSQFSASHTLEYSFSSFAVAQMAKALGKTNEYQELSQRAWGWTNLYDPELQFIRPRTPDGEFIKDFNPSKPWAGFQEGNAWQYTFYVPHHLPELINRMGVERFNGRLDAVFAQAEKTGFGGGKKLDAFSGLENVYNHGNQPSLHIAWLFNQSGRPWLTQYWVRKICDEFYGTDRVHGYGFGQDEDQGQLGAWFVMAGLGLFDVQGGAASEPMMELSTPFFDRVTIQLHPAYHSGKAFEIRAPRQTPEDIYIRSIRLNGQACEQSRVAWKDIVTGGALEVQTSKAPTCD
jgi:predicted alpha-1,2-mannosidase